MREGDFSLVPKERAVYGATITARSLTHGETLTIARTGMTAVEAVRAICGQLDELDDDYRVVSVSTPVSIQRDLYASRVALVGLHAGAVDMPEKAILSRAGRLDMLHPALDRATENATHTTRRKRKPRTSREAVPPHSETAA